LNSHLFCVAGHCGCFSGLGPIVLHIISVYDNL
jgi:hypothetical protein